MLFFHIDHLGRLAPGVCLEPNTVRLSFENWMPEVYMSVCETFPSGLSSFGARALLPTSKPEIVQQHVLEFILEMVRLSSFPKLPSRLSSFFGMRDVPSNSDKWISRLGADASRLRVFECESDRVYTANASCLDFPNLADFVPTAGAPLESPADSVPSILSFPAVHVHAARQYWLSCVPLGNIPACQASSDIAPEQYSPYLEELLVPGLVRVLRQVWP